MDSGLSAAPSRCSYLGKGRSAHRSEGEGHSVQLGPRPFFLVNEMSDGPLKEELLACSGGPFEKTDFSIGHRGAPLQFPEHTVESYEAAARMGAGIVECDVTFTSDQELVCRHSQSDLHTTTNILALLALDGGGSIVPSAYAHQAKAAGLGIITWTLERSGILADGNNGFYYQTVDAAIHREGDLMTVLDVLATDVGILGVFSDWAAPVTYYANCVNIK